MIFKNKYRITMRWGAYWAQIWRWWWPVWQDVHGQGQGMNSVGSAEDLANRHAVDFVTKTIGWLPK